MRPAKGRANGARPWGTQVGHTNGAHVWGTPMGHTKGTHQMVHTSHMEVHQAGGGSMALIKLNHLRLIMEVGKFLNDLTFCT